MAGWQTPDSVHRASSGGIAPAAWGDMVNDNLVFLASTSVNAVNTSQTTTSSTYTDLTTFGPSVTLTTGGKALVWCRAYITNSSAAQDTFMGVAVSGATTLSATDVLRYGVPVAAVPLEFGNFALILSLNAGSNTFTAKYRVGGGTGTFANRNLVVMPLP